MRITTQAWETYIRRLAQLNEKAAQLMAEYLAAHGTADTEALTDYAAALVQKYGEGSAELACQMYDAMAALQNARVSPAEPAAPASRREVARMVLATRESPPQMQRGVSRLVKRAGADTTLKNAQRDGAEFAWVPHGDSCAFCLTLASRGWQRASQAAIKGGHAEHIHANCDCECSPAWWAALRALTCSSPTTWILRAPPAWPAKRPPPSSLPGTRTGATVSWSGRSACICRT